MSAICAVCGSNYCCGHCGLQTQLAEKDAEIKRLRDVIYYLNIELSKEKELRSDICKALEGE